MTRKWLLYNLELIDAFRRASHSDDPLPYFPDLVNTTGRVEIAVFADATYPDLDELRNRLSRGKAAGVVHIFPKTATALAVIATELGLESKLAGLPAGKGSWRKQWRDWALVHRADHVLVFRDRAKNTQGDFIKKVVTYPELAEKIHIFEAGKTPAKKRRKGKSKIDEGDK